MRWLAAFFLALGCVGYFGGYFDGITPQGIREFVRGFGALAPLVFLVLFALAPLAPFFNAVLAMAGGLIFGLWQGSVLIMLGALCGGTLGFWIARTFGDWLRARKPSVSAHQLERGMERNGFCIVFLLRLIPLIPFDVISYGAGFSRMRYREYILATLLGIVPGVLVYANIGANALDVHSWGFYAALGLLAGLTALSLVLKKRLRRRFDF